MSTTISTKSRVEEIKKKLSKDVVAFGRVCFPSMFTVPSAAFHHELGEILLKDGVNRLNVIAPRGHAKSSLVAGVYVVHHLMFSPPPRVVVLISKTENHAVRLLQTVVNMFEHSTSFKQLFGYYGRETSKVWKYNQIVLHNNDAIFSIGTGQQVHGMKYLNQRPTLSIVDDPEDIENTLTTERMERNFQWLVGGVLPGLDPVKGKIVVIGTPIRENCIVEKLTKMAGWTTKKYKALNGDRQDEPLWEEWMSLERLRKEKESLESIGRVSVFYREYQCEIKGNEDQLFKPEYIRYYKGYIKESSEEGAKLVITERDFHAINEELDVVITMGIDPAVSTATRADYTVIMCVAKDKNGDFYVLPYIRRRMPPHKTIEVILSEYEKYKAVRVSIETTGAQETFRDILRNLEGAYIPGLAFKHNPKEKKEKRYLEVLEPYFYKRKVFLPIGESDSLESELLSFSSELGSRSEHDDTLDALYYAVKGSKYFNIEESDGNQIINSYIKKDNIAGYDRHEDRDEINYDKNYFEMEDNWI